MTSNFKFFKLQLFLFVVMAVGYNGLAQDMSTFKAQVALGVNNPSNSGFVQGFEAKPYNFPTVNLRLQYMFSQPFGVKLDYGFSRMSNQDNTQEFKLNYSRINVQLVYDASRIFSFLPTRIGTVAHAGPGFSMVKPLGNYTQNDTSYLNAMAGMEFHYGVSDKLSVFFDASYIKGLSKDFNPVSKGYGSFNGDVLTLTVGVSISLSRCYYCEQND